MDGWMDAWMERDRQIDTFFHFLLCYGIQIYRYAKRFQSCNVMVFVCYAMKY